jgi:hypothetical protein
LASCVTVLPSAEASRDSHATNSSCIVRRAASDTCGDPIFKLAQKTGSNFHVATIVTMPGSSSTCAISPDARRSIKIRRALCPYRGCQR